MIKTTEKLTKKHADAFIESLINGTVPFDFMIGQAQVSPLFGNARKEGDALQRCAALSGVHMTAVFRRLGNAVEVGVVLENRAQTDSPQIHDIDFCRLALPDASEYVLQWMQRRVLYSIGSPSTIYDFEPREEDLTRPEQLLLEEKGGRSSGHYMPYFNCSSQDTQGVIAAIGWSGRWKAAFTNGDGCMNIRFSYPGDFYLKPGEAVALPTVLLMPWKREPDSDRGLTDTFILFRRLMRDYILPQNLVQGYLTLRAWGATTVEEHRSRLDNLKKWNIPCDAYGIDAGWYEKDGNGIAGGWADTLGDWKEAASVHPYGLHWLSEEARKAGAKGFWLWFEFERAVRDCGAYKAHPEFYLSGQHADVNDWEKRMGYINMGDPAAREYIRGILYPLIRRVGITMFRVDFNVDPAPFFAAADGKGRQGITELKYYAGLYEFFTQMRTDFPGLVIDNCAAGGRRLDYRMCAQGVPVNCRSDYFTIQGTDPAGYQAHTVGLSRWLPVHGDSAYSCTLVKSPPKDPYADRSVYGVNYALTAFQGELTPEEGAMYQKLVREALIVREYMSMDFYPLTGYSYSNYDWCAFEYCHEDCSRALVMAFRRDLNASPHQVYALRGLEESATYTVQDLDSEEILTFTGKALHQGLHIHLPHPRSSKILRITKCL